MSYYKFGPNDIFNNVIKTHPQCKFLIHNGNAFYNRKPSSEGEFTGYVGHVDPGHINLYEINVDRSDGQLVYPFVSKNSSMLAPRTVSTSDFNGAFSYGDTLQSSYPLSASIQKTLIQGTVSRTRISALKNVLDFYTPISRHYAFSSSFGDKSEQTVGMVSIPSIFYGSTIKRGSVELNFYITGTLVGQLKDEGRRGELVQTKPEGSTGSGSVAGVVLYNEGFIVLTGSWSLDPNHTEAYGVTDQPKWIYFGQSISGSITAANSSFELDFKGTNPVPVVTMLAHAPAGELNYSSNPTYIEHGQTITPLTGTNHYTEQDELKIKNTVSSSYADPTGSFKKQTYISKVAIYDEKKNLIGVAKLATPVKKTEERDFTFKLKLDF